MLSPAQFRTRFPAFARCSDGLIQAKLDEAYLLCDAGVWAELLDSGAGNYAAHLLTMEPEGREIRIATGNAAGASTYLNEYQRIGAIVCPAILVV